MRTLLCFLVFTSLSCVDNNEAPSFLSSNLEIKVYGSTNSEYVAKFSELMDSYTQNLVRELSFENYEAIKDIDVVIEKPNLTYRGYFYPPNIIVLTDEKKMLSVWGHELVRFIFFKRGLKEWSQSSYEWTGDIGNAWNTAENLSLLYLKEGNI